MTDRVARDLRQCQRAYVHAAHGWRVTRPTDADFGRLFHCGGVHAVLGRPGGGLAARVEAEGIYAEVRAERERAHAKHGDTSMESTPADDPTGRRYRILCEEVGEVAQEFNDAEHDRRPVDLALVRKELIQVAAMAAAWADVCGTAPADEGSVL